MAHYSKNLAWYDKEYTWPRGGEEWSDGYGGPEVQWHGSIMPRLRPFLNKGTIVEIAPGYGRWTHYLKDLCEKLIAVDISKTCIEACKKRFSGFSHISCYVNDGHSLAIVQNETVDLVFSYDSLVHADEETMQAYLRQISKKLKKNGVAFIHHSNYGIYAERFRFLQKLPSRVRNFLSRTEFCEDPFNKHLRDITMTADKFRKHSEEAGLQCISQELINWSTPTMLVDCISIVSHKDSDWKPSDKVIKNRNFTKEMEFLRRQSLSSGIEK